MVTFSDYVTLARESDPNAKVSRASAAFLSLASFSAIAVTMISSKQPVHQLVFGEGYPDECLTHVCTNFVVDNPYYRMLAKDPFPKSWTNIFRTGYEANSWLRPAGYRNGSSVAIRSGSGAEIGSIHANTRQEFLSDRQLEAFLILRDFLGPILEQKLTLDALMITERELEVIRLMTDGSSNAEIADELHITPRTVATHIENLMRKLDVHSRVEIVVTALRLGLC